MGHTNCTKTLQCTAYLLYPYLGFLHHGRRKAYRSDFHLKCLFCANKAHGLPCRGAQRTQTWTVLVCAAWQDMLALTITR